MCVRSCLYFFLYYIFLTHFVEILFLRGHIGLLRTALTSSKSVFRDNFSALPH